MSGFAEEYRGKVRQVHIEGLSAGGANCFPLHSFDGETPNPPRILFEVWDVAPEDWSPELDLVLGDVYGDSSAWLARAVEAGADGAYLRLKSADPQSVGAPIAEVAARAAHIVESSPLPLIVIGCGDPDVDSLLLPLVAGAVKGRKIGLGNAEADSYAPIGKAAQDAGDCVIAYTPMDVSLAKQLNVLLAQAGMSDQEIIMDPTCSALGYSFEYAYTVFERDRIAALAQNDTKMQAPLLANVGQETWHVKESRGTDEELPGQGDRRTRGLLWEGVTAVCLVLAGADMVVVRHPESIGLIKDSLSALGERTGTWR